MPPSACILLVDDEAMNRDALSRRLLRQGYQVTLAASGAEALELMKQQDFDLVLLDVMMPDIDGLHVLATIRETHSHAALPVIMVTARDQGGDVVAALQMGANDYVTKPINFPVLLARIQTQVQIKGSLRASSADIQLAPTSATNAQLQLGATTDVATMSKPAPAQAARPAENLSDTKVLAALGTLPEVSTIPKVPGYEILQHLGTGGMGTVYKARQVCMDRLVALKILNPERIMRADDEQRFYKEVRALGKMSHPNIVLAYDAGQINNTHYVAMEYVDGTDLEKHVRERGPLPLDQASQYIRQAAHGLQHAFERGYVHRDIKPSNLLVHWDSLPAAPNEGKFSSRLSGVFRRPPIGTVKLLDLGLALLKQPTSGMNSSHTQNGRILGTADYMAPEQWRDSHDVDIRADLYSLGCTFYYLLTGLVPFPGDNPMEKMIKHTLEEPVPIEKLKPQLPAVVVNIIRRLLAKRPEDRYPTPAKLAEVL